MYKLSNQEYNHLLTNAVTATYRKVDRTVAETIDKQGKQFAKKKGVLNKMKVNGNSNCFITLKDHKDYFQNNPTTRQRTKSARLVKKYWTTSM